LPGSGDYRGEEEKEKRENKEGKGGKAFFSPFVISFRLRADTKKRKKRRKKGRGGWGKGGGERASQYAEFPTADLFMFSITCSGCKKKKKEEERSLPYSCADVRTAERSKKKERKKKAST